MHTTRRAEGPTRRRALGLAGGAALSLPLASCALPEGSPGRTLDVVYYGDANAAAVYAKLADAFTRDHPGIGIRFRGIPAPNWGTFANVVSTQIAGGRLPDVLSVATEGQRLFASKGILQPLDGYIRRDASAMDGFYADVNPKFRRWTDTYSTTDDHTYYLPGGYNPMVLYCNTRLFARAGVELPDASWTWEEFREAGRRVKRRTGAFLLPIGYSAPFTDVMPWLLTNGANILDSGWKHATFDSPAAVEAATFVKGMLDEGLSPKPGGTFDVNAELARDRLAAFGGGRWPTTDMRRLKLVDRVRIVSWPQQKGPGSPVGWDGWSILKASRKKEHAWTFLTWLSSAAAERYFTEVGGNNVPARESVALSGHFTDNAPEGTRLLVEAVAHGQPIPSPERASEAQDAVNRGWQAALTGTKPVERALADANEQLEGVL
ncbi:ABC transporter substrate-binding protein [Streptomyces sp. NPDC050560]|uniref:ABC transporter substrate-binding protein n=1 Tax=Streptomyces sp. NPDC050560 TaxID=3365630 RepID=UPI0037A6A9A8